MAGAAGAIALSGLAFIGGAADAASTTITAGPGSSVDCNLAPATASLKPALKDNWIKADHQDDADATVRALPDTPFALNGPVTVKSKPKTSSCTGTITNGTATANMVSGSITLGNDPANPGSTDPASCANLITPTSPSTARYNVTIKWKADTAKVTNTNITGAEISSAGGTFSVTGGTITGSFAGGSASTSSSPDGATIGMFLTSTALQPKLVSSANKDGNPCQPLLTITSKKTSLKAPKGIKKIGLASGTLSIDR
jgi:hypothetical protein